MTEILMSSPEYFDVLYAINPHMTAEDGQLHKIDSVLAMHQWNNLREVFENLGVKVHVVPGGTDLPDMVFSANHGLPLFGEDQKVFILGKMATPERAEEIELFRAWYSANGWRVIDGLSEGFIQAGETFEGMGDAAFRRGSDEIWAAFGSRSHAAVWQRLVEKFHLNLKLLELVDERFYHLDTCFSILNTDTVALVPAALSDKSMTIVRESFKQVIEISISDAEQYFAANCWCPDGKHVVVQKGCDVFIAQLLENGFLPVCVDTSEFIKAGGSVYCMKMQLS